MTMEVKETNCHQLLKGHYKKECWNIKTHDHGDTQQKNTTIWRFLSYTTKEHNEQTSTQLSIANTRRQHQWNCMPHMHHTMHLYTKQHGKKRKKPPWQCVTTLKENKSKLRPTTTTKMCISGPPLSQISRQNLP